VFNTTIQAQLVNKKEKEYKVTVQLPPLAAVILK